MLENVLGLKKGRLGRWPSGHECLLGKLDSLGSMPHTHIKDWNLARLELGDRKETGRSLELAGLPA